MAHVKIDESECSIVLHCTDCGVWYSCADTLAGAYDSAVNHEQQSHPGENDMFRTRWAWQKRGCRSRYKTRR